MQFRILHLIVVSIVAFCPPYVYSQTSSAPANEQDFKTVAEVKKHFNDKINEYRRTIEAQKLKALEALMAKASPAERPEALIAAIDAAMFLELYDKVVSLSERFPKDYNNQQEEWRIRVLRYEAMANTGRLEPARKEWLKVSEKTSTNNWQGVFQTGMIIADRLAEVGETDETKKIYDSLKKKLTFVSDLDTILNIKRKQLFWFGRTPPELVGNDLNGKKIDLADYRGKIVLLEFWATWCGPCISQMPNMKRMYDQYHNQGLEIIGVNLDQNLEAAKSFIDQQQINWPHIADQATYRSVNANKYNVKEIPATFLIGTNGKIVYASEPFVGFESVIRRLLAQKAETKK